jgi:hypothetical protein
MEANKIFPVNKHHAIKFYVGTEIYLNVGPAIIIAKLRIIRFIRTVEFLLHLCGNHEVWNGF